jgi:hypothetical protein
VKFLAKEGKKESLEEVKELYYDFAKQGVSCDILHDSAMYLKSFLLFFKAHK